MTGGLAGLLGLPTEGIALFISLTLARPMGLFFGFVIFSWGLGRSYILRVGIALAVCLPMSIAQRENIVALTEQASVIEMALLFLKELALGYGLGFIASLPLLALQYAGAINDSFRGESASGHEDPSGGQLGTWSTYFMVIGILIFVVGGGMQELIRALYESYAAWPLTEMLPPPTLVSVGALLDVLALTLKSAIIVAAPLLFMLMAVDLSLAIASRLAQRFQLMSIEFALKNLVAALLLAPVTAYIVRYLADSPVDFDRVIGVLRTILR